MLAHPPPTNNALDASSIIEKIDIMMTKHQLSSATQAEEVTNAAAMVATNEVVTNEVATAAADMIAVE